MADNLSVTAGTGSTIGMDEVVDGTLGTVKVGFGKIMDGTLDSTNKLIVDSTGALSNNQTRIGSNTIDTNSGNKSAGTQRVVLATDQPAMTNPQPIVLNSLNFPASTNNSSTAQLAASAIFTGTIESVQNLQAAQIEVFSDQPFTLNIDQFIDVAGTKLVSTDTFTRLANVPFNENITLPGNYFRLRVQNTGGSTTTTLQIDTTFGIMATGPRTVTTLGNNRSAVNELNGTAIDTNSGNKSAGTQRVAIATDDINLAAINTSTTGVAKDSSLTTIDTDLKSNITLHAGSNIIGQVGIDQTTPGTTNKVAANLTQVNGTAVSGTNGLPSTITNNTNTADVVAGDTGFNSVVTSAGTKSYTFTTSVAGVQTLLANTDVRGYSYMEIVYTSVGVGLALGGQFSTTSGGTYVASVSFSSAPSSASTSGLGVSNSTVYTGPVRGNFFQIAVSALTSGTFTGTLTLRATPPPLTTLNIAGTVTGGSAAGITGSITTSSTVITSPSVNGYNGFIPVVISGTHAGISFNIQVSADNGTTYVPTSVWDTNAQVWRNPSGGASASITPGTNANNIYYVQVPMSPGSSLIKLTSTAYTSGTGAIRMGGNFAPQPPIGFMSQLMDSAGNGRGANVDANNNLNVKDYSTGATGSGFPTNASYIGLNNGTNLVGMKDVAGASTTGATLGIGAVSLSPVVNNNGLLKSKTICAASTNATSVKGSAGNIYNIEVQNADTVGYFVKFYNKASAPTVGTDTPVATYYAPPGFGFVINKTAGSPYTTGIAFGTTLLATDADTTVVTNANKLVVNIEYI